MIELRYTGATNSSDTQTISSKSLGGYISPSRVPNDDFSNLFDEISLMSKQQNKREARLIGIVNSSAIQDYSSIVVQFTLQSDSDVKYKVAFALPTEDSDGLYFERLNTQRELPAYADFEDVVSGQLLNLGTLSANKAYGMWLIRELTDEFVAPVDCNKLYEDFKAKTLPVTEEKLLMTISYGDASISNSVSVSVSSSVSI